MKKTSVPLSQDAFAKMNKAELAALAQSLYERCLVLESALIRVDAYKDPAAYIADQAGLNKLMADFIRDFPIPVEALRGAAVNWIPKMAAQKAAKESHKNRPEQKAKMAIKMKWNEWQSDPAQYPTLAEFARKMIQKHPVITTPRTVEDWGREWKRGQAGN